MSQKYTSGQSTTTNKKDYFIILTSQFIKKIIKILNDIHLITELQKHMNLTESKGEIDKSPTIVWDFYTLLSMTDWTSWKKISQDIKDLNNFINILELNIIYGTLTQSCIIHLFYKYTNNTHQHRISLKEQLSCRGCSLPIRKLNCKSIIRYLENLQIFKNS